jgi:hypothetical protein
LVEKMRKRIINNLRLSADELKDLMDVGQWRLLKKPIMLYVEAVRPGLMC